MHPDIVPGATFPDYELPDQTSAIRPDWDLSKPGLREAWNAGDLSLFHGWNKRAGQQPAPN